MSQSQEYVLLVQLISDSQQPNTEVVAKATEQLKVILKNVNSILVLMEIIHGDTNPNIKQGACVFLRKNIAKLWSNLE